MKATKANKTRFRTNLQRFIELKRDGALNGKAAAVKERLQNIAHGMGLDFNAEVKAIDEVRDNPVTFIETQAGKLDFGEITTSIGKKIKRQAGKIRLTEEGLAHVEKHLDEIKSVGYASSLKFVEEIAGNFDRIYKGKGKSLLLAKANRPSKMAYIELSPTELGEFYVINTALPTRSTFFKKKELLWERAPSSHRNETTRSAISGHNSSKTEDTKNGDKRENPCGCQTRENPSELCCGLEYIENPGPELRENKGVPPEDIYDMITDNIGCPVHTGIDPILSLAG